MDNTKKYEKKEETLTIKNKRSPDKKRQKAHTQTHESLIEMFRRLQMSFSIIRE